MRFSLQGFEGKSFCVCMNAAEIAKYIGIRLLVAAIPVALVCYALGQLSALTH